MFHAFEAFQQGHEYHDPEIQQKLEEFGTDIINFTSSQIHMLYLDI